MTRTEKAREVLIALTTKEGYCMACKRGRTFRKLAVEDRVWIDPPRPFKQTTWGCTTCGYMKLTYDSF